MRILVPNSPSSSPRTNSWYGENRQNVRPTRFWLHCANDCVEKPRNSLPMNRLIIATIVSALICALAWSLPGRFNYAHFMLAILATVAFILWPKPAPAPWPEPVPAPAPAVTEKSEAPAETSEALPPPAEFTIQLDSRPRNAFVSVNGEKKGRAPFALRLEEGVEATVRFSLPGYRAEVRQVVADADDSLVVRLKKKSRPTPSPIKTEF